MLKKIKKVFIIAEIGLNHNGNLNQAYKLIRSAAKAGADAVKFQTYITEKRAKKDSPIFDILKECELNFSDFLLLKKYAESQNVYFFSTPFDLESVDYLLSNIKIKLIKIASFDSENDELIKRILKYKTDIIMSLGLTNLNKIDKKIKQISKKRNLALLHCITSYPIKDKEANLNSIHFLKNKYDNIIGYSDHSKSIILPSIAVAAGAKIIEKHYMINKNDKCVDSGVSISEKEFKEMIKQIRYTEDILGKHSNQIRENEKKFLFLKRKKIINPV